MVPVVLTMSIALLAGCSAAPAAPGGPPPSSTPPSRTSPSAATTSAAGVPAAQQGRLAWSRGPTMPTALSEVGVAATGTTIHVLGGYIAGVAHSTTDLAFDTVTQSWSTGPPLPVRLDHIGAAAVGNRLFAIGGYGAAGTPTTGVYELVGDRWVARAPIPLARAAAATVVLDGKVHLIGGIAPTGDTDRQDIYDPVTNAWSAAAPIPTPRDHAAGAVVNGRIFVAGGRPGSLTSTVSYDPATDQWTLLPALPSGRNSIAGADFAGRFVVIGGENANETAVFGEVSGYQAGRWSSLPSLPHGLQGIGAVVVNNVLYLPGGGPIGGGSQQSAQLLELRRA